MQQNEALSPNTSLNTFRPTHFHLKLWTYDDHAQEKLEEHAGVLHIDYCSPRWFVVHFVDGHVLGFCSSAVARWETTVVPHAD